MKLGSAIYVLRQVQNVLINNISLDKVNKSELFYAISIVIKEIERKYDKDEQ